MFAAVFSTAHHFSLSSARLTKSIPYHPLSWRSILMLSFNLYLGFPISCFLKLTHQAPVRIFLLVRDSHFPRPNQSEQCKSRGSNTRNVSCFCLSPDTPISTTFSKLSLCASIHWQAQFYASTKQQAKLQSCVFWSLYSETEIGITKHSEPNCSSFFY
jgi:hypothetical protein